MPNRSDIVFATKSANSRVVAVETLAGQIEDGERAEGAVAVALALLVGVSAICHEFRLLTTTLDYVHGP